jgi:hypothetical protein
MGWRFRCPGGSVRREADDAGAGGPREVKVGGVRVAGRVEADLVELGEVEICDAVFVPEDFDIRRTPLALEPDLDGLASAEVAPPSERVPTCRIPSWRV